MKMKLMLLGIFCLAALTLTQAQQQPTGSFGKQIDEKGAMSLEKLSKKMQKSDNATVKVKGTIKEVCQVKGCWITMDLGNGEIMRVKFKDYGFFVPKDAAGKSVTMEGTASRQMIEVDELKHLAEDAGKTQAVIDAIDQPKEEFTFVADGVLIK